MASVTVDELVERFQTQYDEAKASNEARYADILSQYQTMYDTTMGRLEGLGTTQIADATRRWDAAGTKVGQDMVSRGLSGTTILPTMALGVERDKSADIARITDELEQKKIGIGTGLKSAQLGFMERREDPYPNMSDVFTLAQSAGTTQGGQGDEQSGAIRRWWNDLMDFGIR